MQIQRLRAFINYILGWYQLYGRQKLPWRQTTNPYHILVSELMLQQTQVSRVIPKYEAFIYKYPTLEIVRQSALSDVLVAWQGLGYNRRAKYLWLLAQQICTMGKTELPSTATELQELPGIGPYTAAAVSVFAYNQPAIVLETNIRAVLLHHFFPVEEQVDDKQLSPILEACLPYVEPRDWYAALMDYGSQLKSELSNPSRKSKHYTKQSKFLGSRRQVRGEILRMLAKQPALQADVDALKRTLLGNSQYFELAVEQLCHERLVSRQGQVLRLGTYSID